MLLSVREKSASVQTHFTQFGRVELDPFGIPAPGKALRESDAFARELQAQLDQPAEAEAAPTDLQVEAVEAENAAAEVEADAHDPVTPEAQAAAAAMQSPAPEPEPAPQPRTEELTLAPAERASVAARSTVPPEVAPAESKATAPSAVVAIATAAPNKATTPAAVSLLAGQTAAPTNRSADHASLAGREQLRLNRAGATSAVSGYRSVDRLAAQRFEAARESVLKQIAFKLHDGTSEARMQLHPPELGQLDLRLAVDAAGQTRLSVVAERPEMAALLSLHMASLTAALQAQGLTVAHAEVRSRNGRTPFTPPPDPLSAAAASGDNDLAGAAPLQVLRARGFVSASGLDFWV